MILLPRNIFERQPRKEEKLIRIRLSHTKNKDVLNIKKQPEVMWALPGFPQVCFVYTGRPHSHQEKTCKLA